MVVHDPFYVMVKQDDVGLVGPLEDGSFITVPSLVNVNFTAIVEEKMEIELLSIVVVWNR